jgi:hypothetical protein
VAVRVFSPFGLSLLVVFFVVRCRSTFQFILVLLIVPALIFPNPLRVFLSTVQSCFEALLPVCNVIFVATAFALRAAAIWPVPVDCELRYRPFNATL